MADTEYIELDVQDNNEQLELAVDEAIIQAVSPKAYVTREIGQATITVTDIDGTSTAVVYDGQTGPAGQDGISAGFGTPTATIDSNTGTPSVTVTASGPDTEKVFAFDFKNLKGSPGQNGTNGQDGQDGFSPTATVTKTGKTATISITDKNGTTTQTVSDGNDGTNGTNGAAAGFGAVTASVDSNVGTPSVTVTASGSDTAKNFDFSFHNLKGRDGSGAVTDVQQNGTSVLDGSVAKVTVPTNVSQLANDSGYITDYTETDPVFSASAAKDITNSDISNWNGKSDFSGSYNDLTNKPTIPSKVSDLQNDSGFINTETDPTVPSWAKASTKPSYTASEVGAVPTTRKVNNKALSSDVTLDASDVGAQETLVSGTNIKTVNNESLLGSGNLTIQGGSDVEVTQVSITVANWNATTTCTKTVTGVTASNSIIVSPAPASISDYVSAGVYCSAQASGTLTFECTSTPTADLVVNVMIVG